jgi:hypothetical protein
VGMVRRPARAAGHRAGRRGSRREPAARTRGAANGGADPRFNAVSVTYVWWTYLSLVVRGFRHLRLVDVSEPRGARFRSPTSGGSVSRGVTLVRALQGRFRCRERPFPSVAQIRWRPSTTPRRDHSRLPPLPGVNAGNGSGGAPDRTGEARSAPRPVIPFDRRPGVTSCGLDTRPGTREARCARRR